MIDWTDAFDNSSYVQGSDRLPDLWAKEAASFRSGLGQRAQVGLAYGAYPREWLDLFLPEGAAKGTVVFVHGGYWHKLDRSYFSHFAAGPLAKGWAVAMPSYPLAPEASISAITTSISRAVRFVAKAQEGPLRLIGHSAGGHLVSRMACAEVLPDDVTERIARVVSVSGLHMLEPITLSAMNDTLGMSEEEAREESPALAEPLTDVPVTVWVGAEERPELIRQTRLLAEAWTLEGADMSSHYERGRNHFDVIDGLRLPDSNLTKELLR
ncbi:MAG: alpha/beta hydrolase [Litoreibacter sp.]|nr:alpha/beta hydrolase [Litoreibacter sp.]